MKIKINCTKLENASCPTCGSKQIVGQDKECCHCGQCGQLLEINIVSNVTINEEADDSFKQLSFFEV